MSIDVLIRVPVGLLPVLIFLVALVYLDGYKLVKLRAVLWVIVAGGMCSITAMYLNGWILSESGLNFTNYSRYVAPLVEESLKALVMIFLFRSSRIGFLVDAAVMGFAVGAGFALVENLYYLQNYTGANLGVWVVRGFGTAIMHGGVMAIFGIMSQALTERSMRINPVYYLPGLLVATFLHSLFNHFFVSPITETLATLLILPPVLYLVFRQSASAMHDWLELDFDADAQLIAMINSGEFSSSKIGQFLDDFTSRFDGPVVVDMLCYLRIYTELAIRAKGMLMMRENGLEVPTGERTRAKFEELRYLEKSIGKTGCLAMKPFLHMERKDLWQMNVLGEKVT
jgi:RsiW-degrading membrane proteinase PrsW (M82 family)